MASKLWWLIHKDLLTECRTRRVGPAMLALGAIVALVFSLQADLPAGQRPQIVGSLLWLAVFFAGTVALDRSFASEREGGGWQGLLLYPVPPTLIYLAKLAVNAAALVALACVLVPLFAALCGVPLLAHPAAMLLVVVLASLGIAAVGTLVSALAAGTRQAGNLLVLLVLPLVTPVVLGAAEATRLAAENNLGAEWWRWVQLLGGFAAIFITAGVLLFEVAIEE